MMKVHGQQSRELEFFKTGHDEWVKVENDIAARNHWLLLFPV